MLAWMLPEQFRQWIDLMATPLDRRSRKYWLPLIVGLLFAQGRRTASRWFVAAGITDDWRDHYYFLSSLGRKTKWVATELLKIAIRQIPQSHVGEYVRLAIDDSPTKRFGPQVEGAGTHHNPTPGPAGSAFLYGHVWVTLSWVVRHPQWGTIGLPLRALMYIRRCDLESLRQARKQPWDFRTKLELAAELLEWSAGWFQNWLHKPVIAVVDGAYAKRPFLQRAEAIGVTVVSRLRKDAALRSVPVPPRRRGRGRPRKYGDQRLQLARRGTHRQGWTTERFELYGQLKSVTYKTFLATYKPAGGLIRVVIIRQDDGGWMAFFSTDPQLPVRLILECVADRAAIEQNFHDVKEVHGAGQQQLRNVFSNVAAWHVCLWMHTLVELWSWRRSGPQLKQRDDRPWDSAARRPSHADRVKTLRRQAIRETFSAHQAHRRLPRKIQTLLQHLTRLAG
jgi:hypothetical protein